MKTHIIIYSIVGFSYVFGAQDTDNDGVSDKMFMQIPGKEFEGCPDTDGDGIPDIKMLAQKKLAPLN